MRRNGWIKMGGVALAMAFCLFFGVTLAAQGTERVGGPLVRKEEPAKSRSYSAAPAGASTAAVPVKPKAPAKPAKPEPAAVPGGDTGINRVGNKAGDLLQIAAYHSIRFIVALFEAILR
ncbi:hypothetical protein ACFQI7_06205 [Paenibacillus allorhizosphaerae]|uniref:Uncharacterized protein n=1 Tax=Paenibacillus allorhizosphaerae TaxID=2849866 RepID=A0ABN7TL36_9BACL|nr:hypothetical protein [Paenibacillus allorhizosphaerae]CAG7634712.1 hypothetical protein PAECIP111802_02058 [Paenibacillus allorhizosphaerae]